jgi:hypothetical protein
VKTALGQRSGAATVPARAQARSSDAGATIKIATFNIQTFGKTKAHDSEILAQLAVIIRRYDVVVVQEVKDISNRAPRLLLAAINRDARSYALLLSQRSGLQANDLPSQESYAVYYDTATVQPLPGERLYDDSEQDRFQREPYLTHLKSVRGDFSFVLIDIHTRPESAVSEIGGLEEVTIESSPAPVQVPRLLEDGASTRHSPTRRSATTGPCGLSSRSRGIEPSASQRSGFGFERGHVQSRSARRAQRLSNAPDQRLGRDRFLNERRA